MIGQKFGRWTVLATAGERTFPSGITTAMYLCRCECGTERNVQWMSLRNGTSQSCGCLARERSSQRHTKHGATINGRTPEYKVWQAMNDRCHNPSNPRYAAYGGRGITVDPRWETDFAAFLADMGPRPSPKHSIDRRDNDLGYGPDNCRWSLPPTQATNRRNTLYVGEVPLATLGKHYGIPLNTLRFRILKGWPLDEALTKPVRPKRPHRA